MRRLAAAFAAATFAACVGGQPRPDPAPLEAPPAAAAGVETARPSPPEPKPITRALEAWLGRQIHVSTPGAPPEKWFLREIGGDHVTIERSRTYRVIPVRRIAEITWTDLSGIDPTPRIVLAAD